MYIGTDGRNWAEGYDGNAYASGCRVEIHPGTDLWMRGVRFGTVACVRDTERDRVVVVMDNGRKYQGTEDTFRAIV